MRYSRKRNRPHTFLDKMGRPLKGEQYYKLKAKNLEEELELTENKLYRLRMFCMIVTMISLGYFIWIEVTAV